jgi:hypothetical protein
LPKKGEEILLAHQTLDFSDRNALKLAYKQAQIQIFSRGLHPINKNKREEWEGIRVKHASEQKEK